MGQDLEHMTFEDASDQLESVVRRLEEGDMNLAEAIALYERGMLLARHCSDLLDKAELQVEELAMIGSQQQEEDMQLLDE